MQETSKLTLKLKDEKFKLDNIFKEKITNLENKK